MTDYRVFFVVWIRVETGHHHLFLLDKKGMHPTPPCRWELVLTFDQGLAWISLDHFCDRRHRHKVAARLGEGWNRRNG